MVVFYKWFQFKQITSARQKTSYASEVETKFYNVLFKEFKEKWKITVILLFGIFYVDICGSKIK